MTNKLIHMSLLKKIIIDFRLNSFSSFVVLFCYRVSNFIYINNPSLLKLWRGVEYVIRFLLHLDAQISAKAKIGTNIRLLHRGQGVVISAKAIIGDYVTIYHQVTVGINEGLPKDFQTIYIDDHCYLSAGSKVISCHLGENSKVGPNAVAYRDTPPNSLIVLDVVYKHNYYSQEKV